MCCISLQAILIQTVEQSHIYACTLYSSHTKKECTHILYEINCVHCVHSRHIYWYLYVVAVAAAASTSAVIVNIYTYVLCIFLCMLSYAYVHINKWRRKNYAHFANITRSSSSSNGGGGKHTFWVNFKSIFYIWLVSNLVYVWWLN